jgi:NAD(P)-dependent dehydrogenase (short-subunit alcohol dehydrogenase family)
MNGRNDDATRSIMLVSYQSINENTMRERERKQMGGISNKKDRLCFCDHFVVWVKQMMRLRLECYISPYDQFNGLMNPLGKGKISGVESPESQTVFHERFNSFMANEGPFPGGAAAATAAVEPPSTNGTSLEKVPWMDFSDTCVVEPLGMNQSNDGTKSSSSWSPVAEITYGDLRTAVRVLNAVAALNRHQTHRTTRKDLQSVSAGSTLIENREKACDNVDDNHDTDADNDNDTDDEGLNRYRHQLLRPLRVAIAGCIALHERTMYDGQTKDQYQQKRYQKHAYKRRRMAEKAQYQNLIASTRLRQGRVEKLRQLLHDQADTAIEQQQLVTAATGSAAAATTTAMSLLVPDGHVNTSDQSSINESTTTTANTSSSSSAPCELPELRSCYVCKARYRILHHFYDQLCPSCATLNWNKRHATANLHGKVAVVTGSRVKIGYQTCLKLLRAGCIVIATTRFPQSAVVAYRQEVDFHQWSHQLHIYGLDLRDVLGIEVFCQYLKQMYPSGLDILINNACQTIRRPRGYYLPLVVKEQDLWSDADDVHQNLLQGCKEFERIRRTYVVGNHDNKSVGNLCHGKSQTLSRTTDSVTPMQLILHDDAANDESHEELIPFHDPATNGIHEVKQESTIVATPFEMSGVAHSAAMSQMVVLPEDIGIDKSILPTGASDINGQQIDLRVTNSWLLKMNEVSTPELMECMLVNAIAPFVLNSRLQELMIIPSDNHEDSTNTTLSRPDRYIINVSAMEGKFYRYKMPNHPHTNMAKAALNMLTRTASEDLAKRYRIYMNSVDTGWINDENPLHKAAKIAVNNNFQTPIDEIDAAARILDPIFSAVNGIVLGSSCYGKFLKDYHESEW